ncbi:prepilin peptidase [Angustibacter speluncae]
MTLVIVAVLGLAIGSFLNVVIWRVPRGESVVSPPSACPSCGHEITPRDNVPVLSWLLLGGQCRHCHERISVRYPLVEAGTAAFFVVVALRFGPSWELPAFLYLAAITVALALIDIDVRRLPNAIVLPSYPVAAVLLVGAALLQGEPGTAIRAVLAGLALYAVYFVLAFIYPAGMGFGDVKLAGVLGLYLGYLGWGEVVVGWFLGFLVGGLGGAVLIVLRRAGRKSKIPFGPYMLVGAWLSVLAAEPMIDWYLGLSGIR